MRHTTDFPQIIPYNANQLYWHLTYNVFGLASQTIDKIVEQCNLVNEGKMDLDDEIVKGSGVTMADMLEDLKIDFAYN
jgi:hypothetical protein